MGAAGSIPLNILFMIWLIRYGMTSDLNLMYAIISIIPGIAQLMKLWIIFSSSFKPDMTLCCFWGWMVGHIVLMVPSIALHIAFAVLILAPFDPKDKDPIEIAFATLLKAMEWLACVNIMAAALELFSIVGYIMYHRGIRADGNVS
jgi:hypothetical protein